MSSVIARIAIVLDANNTHRHMHHACAPVGEVVILHEDFSLLAQPAGASLLAVIGLCRDSIDGDSLRGGDAMSGSLPSRVMDTNNRSSSSHHHVLHPHHDAQLQAPVRGPTRGARQSKTVSQACRADRRCDAPVCASRAFQLHVD